jgi:hypothetical protein
MILPQLPSAESFYALRDSRSSIGHPLANLPPLRIAIMVPSNAVSSGLGIEIALFWTASIIRRMGRPFSEVILVASDEFRQSTSRLSRVPGISVEQLVSEELRSADPFGAFEWRTWAKNVDLADATAVVQLGTLPLGVIHPQTIAINAHGWVSVLQVQPNNDLSLSPPDFDAAPSAIVFAACMAAGKLFSEAFGALDGPGRIAFALDGGGVCTDPTVYGPWLENGTSLVAPPPWKAESGARLALHKLLVVSAGGVGGNFCKILGDSHFRVHSAYVLDPDNFEISNLNRSIGVGLQFTMPGSSKASFASNALLPVAENVTSVQSSYESWVTPELAEQFRLLGTAVVVGVDQVCTRLKVGSDWPWMLLNGATSGSTFSTSIHLRRVAGCVGCWYGQSETEFAATRQPMACAAGVAGGGMVARPIASYPFVSVAASAQMVGTLARAVFQNEERAQFAGNLTRMSLRTPESAQVQRIDINKRCLLLCGEDYLQQILERSNAEGE